MACAAPMRRGRAESESDSEDDSDGCDDDDEEDEEDEEDASPGANLIEMCSTP